MKVRINPRRQASLLIRLEQGCYEGACRAPGSWIIILDAGVIHVRDTGEVFVDRMTPAVQSFLSRVPLSDAPDSQQSDSSDSDTAQPQSGGGDSRCEDAQKSSSEEQSSSLAVGSFGSDAEESASSASDESRDSSDASGHAQADSESSSEDSEPQPGSSPDAGASGWGEGMQAEQGGAAKASSPDAPGDEEGTEGHVQSVPAPSPPAGEVSSFSVAEAATENKGLNPFRISLRLKPDHGGVFARLSDAESQPSRALIQRARAVFARMLHGGEGDPGARWRASHVATKTAGYLRSWSIADRRAEDGRPAILILSDVSGSMSAYARDVLQFALAVSRIGLPGGEIVAVAQSNGYPAEVLEGKVRNVAWLGIYQQLIARYEVRAVVIAADHDGEAIYRVMYEQTTARYYWLHAYASAQAERVRLVRPGHGLWPEWARPDRLRMAYGCGSAERALEAMERMLISAP